MSKAISFDIQLLSWDKARTIVQAVNPILTKLIDEIDPDSSYQLIQANYRFGDMIVRNGLFNLPLTGKGTLAINDVNIPLELKKSCFYSPIPLFLLTKNAVEVSIDTEARIIPLNLFKPGSLLGLFESIDFLFNKQAAPKWNVSSGARTMFLLPKISEVSGFKRLKKEYGLASLTAIKHLTDHGKLLIEIANSKQFSQSWNSSILIFTDKWLGKKNRNAAWFAFHEYLFYQGWQQVRFSLSAVDLGLLWERFAEEISGRQLKPRPFIADQIKHILSIANGNFPAFRPADNLQQIGPTKSLQQAFIDVYQLKDYVPSIMHSCLLSSENDGQPVYYSLAFPTILEGASQSRGASSTIMLDLRDMKFLINILLQEKMAAKDLGQGLSNIDFDFFHVEKDMFAEIKPSTVIVEEDARFVNEQIAFPGREFCGSSPFWRGCVRVSRRK